MMKTKNLQLTRRMLSLTLAVVLMGSQLSFSSRSALAAGPREIGDIPNSAGDIGNERFPVGISNNFLAPNGVQEALPNGLDLDLNLMPLSSPAGEIPAISNAIPAKAQDQNQGNSGKDDSTQPEAKPGANNKETSKGDANGGSDSNKKESSLKDAEGRVEKSLAKAKDVFNDKKDQNAGEAAGGSSEGKNRYGVNIYSLQILIRFERRLGIKETTNTGEITRSEFMRRAKQLFEITRSIERRHGIEGSPEGLNLSYSQFSQRVERAAKLRDMENRDLEEGLRAEKAANRDLQNGWDRETEEEEGKHLAAMPARPKTPTLDEFGTDLTQEARQKRLDPVYGRDKEVSELIGILTQKRKRNAVLIGEAGVGKTAIVEGLAQKIASDEVPVLKGKRIVSLDISALLAGTKYRGEFEERVTNLLKELEGNPDVILFIDEIHQIVGANSSSSDKGDSMNMANMLKTALARGRVQVIGATTFDEYKKFIEKDSALERRLQTISVKAPTADEAVLILKTLRPGFEKHHGVRYDDAVLKTIADLSSRYIYGRNLPDSAIDVMDGVGSSVRASGRNLVTEADVRAIVSKISGVPVENLGQDEKNRLTHIEDYLSQRIKGQEEAIRVVSEAVRADRAGFKTSAGPLSFLFAGPTGVGKTETGKALAEFLFGSDKNLIRLDMSEYQGNISQSRLESDLTEKVRRNPYSVVLLDEIDKANPAFLNLLLQVLDEGRFTDGTGKLVDFSHAIIVMSANYMSRAFIEKPRHLGFNSESSDPSLADRKAAAGEGIKGLLPPEFYNRIGDVVVFNPLSREAAGQILDGMLAQIKNIAKEKNIDIEISLEARDFLIGKGYDASYGARPMRRAVDAYLARPLAMESLKSDAPQHLRVVVSSNGEGLGFETL